MAEKDEKKLTQAARRALVWNYKLCGLSSRKIVEALKAHGYSVAQTTVLETLTRFWRNCKPIPLRHS